MKQNMYSAHPHAYHAQTFPLDLAPLLTPLTRHVPAPDLALILEVGWRFVNLFCSNVHGRNAPGHPTDMKMARAKTALAIRLHIFGHIFLWIHAPVSFRLDIWANQVLSGTLKKIR